ncbi:hypothetical protein ZWY2020_000956 [Hordeum vulgare]|nr:hypothetical protein ZWY2020_000956 [Hordeum vulgare]
MSVSARGRKIFLSSPQRGVHVVDCCNGLLLCRFWSSHVSALGDELFYIVSNPATEEWFRLPDRSHGDASSVSAVRLCVRRRPGDGTIRKRDGPILRGLLLGRLMPSSMAACIFKSMAGS